MFIAKYTGTCAAGGDRIRPGDQIARSGGGYAHTTCRMEKQEPPDWVQRPGERDDDWELRLAREARRRDEAEYAAGIEDARRYRETSQMFGEEYAAQLEFERDMRGLNGEW